MAGYEALEIVKEEHSEIREVEDLTHTVRT